MRWNECFVYEVGRNSIVWVHKRKMFSLQMIKQAPSNKASSLKRKAFVHEKQILSFFLKKIHIGKKQNYL